MTDEPDQPHHTLITCEGCGWTGPNIIVGPCIFCGSPYARYTEEDPDGNRQRR